MSWTFTGLKQLENLKNSYEAELERRFTEVDDDEDAAQKVLNESDAKDEFFESVKSLEYYETRDPATFLKAVRLGRERYFNFYGYRSGPFTLVYLRDPASQTATAVLFYHYRDEALRLNELAELLRR